MMIVIKASGCSGHRGHDIEDDLQRAFHILRTAGVRFLGGGAHSDGRAFVVRACNADRDRAVDLIEAAIADKRVTALESRSRAA